MSEVLTPEKHTSTMGSELTNNVAVMDQYSTVTAESPVLERHKAPVSRAAISSVTLKEVALMGHMILRGDSDNPQFVNEVSKVLGVPLPTEPLTSSETNELSVSWVSPDEWLIILPAEKAFDLEVALRASLSGHYSIVNQSGGQTILELSGPDAVNVLKKSTPVDVHSSAFPVGKVVTSVLAKTTALVRRVDDSRWQLIVRRSFADYAWRWLADAGKEYGLVIEK
ncbi:sarcosine oxidase subunit gamma [Vibrio albus]|jgi:sarcosine oxidase subunit gamma|uniref:Sarcosine oxidase subunit gamma n=1 Tax=Vibrio albus TaxID=2200953 RepID=A0A2U3B9W7_9VIBR|nr:sarcosine oxidase subunit gamma family protein [Vibrio albus]PWI33571.1 sarcosine oxidase subunit gamma [Vibrio albus]